MRDLRAIFPSSGHGYRGATAALWFLVVANLVTTARSLVHIIAPDGAANSIARIEVDLPGGDNLVAKFAQWGLEQLLLALVAWVIILRYRFLLLHLLDLVGRIGVGLLKPLEVADPPLGAIGNFVFLPLVAIALWYSLPRTTDERPRP